MHYAQYLKAAIFMFHRVVLPKNRVEFCQQFNGAISYSLEMHYVLVRRRINILVDNLITIVFFISVVFGIYVQVKKCRVTTLCTVYAT